MRQIFDQLIRLLQEGVSAVFRFVQMVWHWTIDQVMLVINSPWQTWPLWRQAALGLLAIIVVGILVKAAMELWATGEAILAAFATLLGMLVRTLPLILLAGAIAAGGLWLINTVSTRASFAGLDSGYSSPARSAVERR